jgi:hypothetical protein
MGNARNNIFVNYMRATEIETKGTSCPQYFTYCCIFSLYIYEKRAMLAPPTKRGQTNSRGKFEMFYFVAGLFEFLWFVNK